MNYNLCIIRLGTNNYLMIKENGKMLETNLELIEHLKQT